MNLASIITKAVIRNTSNIFDKKFIEETITKLENTIEDTLSIQKKEFDVDKYSPLIESEIESFLAHNLKGTEASVEDLSKLDIDELLGLDYDVYLKGNKQSKKQKDIVDRLFKTREDILGSSQENWVSEAVASSLNRLKILNNKYKTNDDIDLKVVPEEATDLINFLKEDIIKQDLLFEKDKILSEEGATIVARNIVAQLLDDADTQDIITKLFKSVPEEQDYSDVVTDPLSQEMRKMKQQEYVSSSEKQDNIFRMISSQANKAWDVSHAFAREVGMHAGTKGQAHSIMLNYLYAGLDPITERTGLKITPEYADEMMMKRTNELREEGLDVPAFALMRGYARVRNPLVFEQEPQSWDAVELLSGVNPIEVLVEKQAGKRVDPKFYDEIDELTRRSVDIVNKNLNADGAYQKHFRKIKREVLGIEVNTRLRKLLEKSGFDSIKYKNSVESSFKGEDDWSYILFNPYQFKSEYSKAFDPEDPRAGYMAGGIAKAGAKILAPAIEGLFSPAEKAALNLPLSKKQLEQGMPGDFYINKLMQTGENVTKDELEFTGFIEAFKDRKNVKLEEVQRFFEDNPLNLKEKRSKFYKQYSLAQRGNRNTVDPFNEQVDNANIFPKEDSENYYEATYVLPDTLEGSKYGTAHFGDGALGHYRVSKLPEKNTNEKVYVLDELQSDYHQAGRKEGYEKKPNAGLANLKRLYRDEFTTIQEATFRMYDFSSQINSLSEEVFTDPETGGLNKKGKEFFKSYVEGDLRGTEKLKSEILSKYSSTFLIDDLIKEIFDTKNPTSEKLTELYVYSKYMPGTSGMVKDVSNLYILDLLAKAQGKTFGEAIKKGNTKKPIDIFNEQLKEVKNKIESFYSNLDESVKIIDSNLDIFKAAEKTGKPPRAPYEKNWYKFLMNKALINAVKEGHNKIALTKSETQALRYNYGEDQAKGFIKYYDEIYPKYLNNFGKKYGVELEDTIVVSPNGEETWVRALPITPEMKKDIQKGLPKFAEGGLVDDATID